MTDITLHGNLSEILQHHALMVDKHLTVTVHMDANHGLTDAEQDGIQDEAHLRKLLEESMLSGPAVPVTKAYWTNLQKRIDARAAG